MKAPIAASQAFRTDGALGRTGESRKKDCSGAGGEMGEDEGGEEIGFNSCEEIRTCYGSCTTLPDVSE